MALEAGIRFGSYEVVEPIGAGGMGEIWRARDTALNRDVAIKVLPQAFVEDAERLARFQREAEILAALNHANIATIHGLERIDDQTVIVMELVEGPTLAEKIAEGPIPPDEAMGIALQIVAALEAAHDKQIVHRDLKPANVKVKDDGTVKVLDFGISKPMDPQAISGSAVATTPAVTQTGIILGTAAYMSPEQARGRFVDQRTDIWAFGCLLFEMLTGQPAFAGEDVMAILARVIDRDTDLGSMPKTVSPAVRHTIRLCLEKNANERISHMRDVRLSLAGKFESELPRPVLAAASESSIKRFALPIGLAIGAAVAGLVVWVVMLPEPLPPPAPAPVNRFDYDVPETYVFRRTGRPVMALSPDGRHFSINTNSGILLRPMAELGARLISGTEEDLSIPFFSPDGQSLAYFTFGVRQIKRMALTGGAPVVIASGLDNPIGASWEADGTIFLGQENGIVRVPSTGGTPELVIPAQDGERLHGPQLLPNGDSVLFSADRTRNWGTAEIVVASLATGERTVVLTGGSDARYLPTGHLVYAYEDNLFGIAFDLETLSVAGGPVPLVQGLSIALSPSANTPAANYAVADDGTLAYLTGAPFASGGGLANWAFVWVDHDDNETVVGIPPCACEAHSFALSPDGARAAVEINDGAESDLWIWSFAAETLTRLTFEAGNQGVPVWTPDSQRIIYASEGEGILARAADGTGSVETLLAEPSISASTDPAVGQSLSLDADGNVVFAMRGDIHVLSIADGAVAPLLAEEYDENIPKLSPDGRWIAYRSTETGFAQVYVRPYPDVDSGKWQVSTGAGAEARPQWSTDGSRLYYINFTNAQLMEARVSTEPSFSRQTPQALFSIEGTQGFRPDAAGERFLILKDWNSADDAGNAEPPKVVVVQNWLEELRRLVPTD